MVAFSLENRQKSNPDLCIWMQAGVVYRKICQSNYQCTTCRFDRVLRRTCEKNNRLKEHGKPLMEKQGKIVFWKEKLKERPQWQRPCIHHMKKRIEFKACTRDYKCENCEFDQYFNDLYTVHSVVRPVDFLDIDGFKIPQGFYLHRGHAWMKVEEGSEVRIGLDDFAMRLLGPLDQIEAPLVGKTLKQDRPDILMIRGRQKAKMLSPVSGVVTAINPKLRERGDLSNQDPYSEGWVLRVHSKNLRQDLKNLMIGRETEDFYIDEVDRLYSVIEKEAGPLTADGGQLGRDIYSSIPQVGWERLVNLFLHT